MTKLKNNFLEIRKGVYAYQLGKIQERRVSSTGKLEIYKPVRK